MIFCRYAAHTLIGFVLTGSFRLAHKELGEQELLRKEKDVWKVLRSYSFPNPFENVFKLRMGEHTYFFQRRRSGIMFFFLSSESPPVTKCSVNVTFGQ